jgi:hypothetical protein
VLKTTYFVAVAVLLGGVSFLISAAAPHGLLLVWSVLVGVGALFFVRFLDQQEGETPSDVAPMVIAASALVAAWVVKLLVNSQRMTIGGYDAAAVLLAVGSAWLVDALTSRPRMQTCFICKQPAGATPFTCPRCRLTICSRPSCWIARHYRCKYCDDREVILFPTDERWWRTRLGPRVTSGSCCYCYKEAGETDLRACGQCHWPQCRKCWDLHNGQCTHCGWILPDLPKSLLPFLGVAAQTGGREVEARRRT